MIRIAAIADVHFTNHLRGKFAPHWNRLHELADALLIAGDLTTHGEPAQLKLLVRELEGVQVPIVAVLGNHDHHKGHTRALRAALERNRVTVLECESTVISIRGARVGIAGTKGFGGGFIGASVAPFGELHMKAFALHTERLARRLEDALCALDTDYRIALTHYSPVRQTVIGERPEIFPFLGSYLLAEAIDDGKADLAIHGHAHAGQEWGTTSGGIPVRNVAFPLLERPYAVFELSLHAPVAMPAIGSYLPSR